MELLYFSEPGVPEIAAPTSQPYTLPTSSAQLTANSASTAKTCNNNYVCATLHSPFISSS